MNLISTPFTHSDPSLRCSFCFDACLGDNLVGLSEYILKVNRMSIAVVIISTVAILKIIMKVNQVQSGL